MRTASRGRPAPLRAAMSTLAVVTALAATAPASALAAPALTATPSAHDFGIQHVDWGQQQTNVSIRNDGTDPLQVTGSSISGSGAGAYWVAYDGCVNNTLASGQSCSVGVAFDPSAAQAYAATLHVHAGGEETTVALSGIGGREQPVATPAALSFGTVAVGASETRSVTVSNAGTLPFQPIVAIPVGGNVGAFRVDLDGCSMRPLTPGAACVLSVRFAPFDGGPAQARLALIGNSDQPLLIDLIGEGREPAVAADGSGTAAPSTSASPPAPAGGAPGAAPDTAASAPANPSGAPASRRPAGVAFDARAGLPVPLAYGRIELGVARCAPAADCTVTARAWVHSITPDGRRTAKRLRTAVWRPAGGRRVALALRPATGGDAAAGSPRVLVLVLTTTAPGRSASVRTLVTRLIASDPSAGGAARR